MAVQQVTSLAGQSVVGERISTPWLTGGPYEVTQGWGSTGVASEPSQDRAGKHYSHWHAGIDLSAAGITSQHVVFPHGLGQQATAVYLDNPAGYGTALILRMWTQSYAGRAGGTAQVRNADIYLGHLATRLIKNGATVREGDILAVPDSTGNSTGPHLHFEVRPPDGRYGTDVDPSQWLLQGNASLQQIPNPLDPLAGIGQAITQAEQSFMNTVVGLAQTALGGTMMLAGGVTVGFGLRGMSRQQALGVTRRTARQLNQRRPEFDLTRRRRTERAVVGPAERTRLRPSLRREAGGTPVATIPRSAPQAPTQPLTRAQARGMVPMRYGVPIRGREARQLRANLPRKLPAGTISA